MNGKMNGLSIIGLRHLLNTADHILLLAGKVVVVHETLEKFLHQSVGPFVKPFDQFVALNVETIDVMTLRSQRRG